MATVYTVVENAGYDRETDVREFADYGKAIRYVERHYTAAERDNDSPECLHVGIRADRDDGSREFI